MESTTLASPMRKPVRACGSKYGQLDMDSMPPATTVSDSPSCTACAASATAFRPEPQTLLMVMAAPRGWQPPFSDAWREGFCPRPDCTPWAQLASDTCLGSRPAP